MSGGAGRLAADPPAAGCPGRSAPAEAARSFSRSDRAPRDARHFVVDTLQQWGEAALAYDAAMVVTELATNAVVHARTGFTVTVSPIADAIRISVRDGRPAPGPDIGALLVPAAGHGLGLVAAVARHWAAEALPDGKRVWAEIG
jgi:anti-sigma regulatory factor (Ser/Thr protein kinase)